MWMTMMIDMTLEMKVFDVRMMMMLEMTVQVRIAAGKILAMRVGTSTMTATTVNTMKWITLWILSTSIRD